MATDRRSFVKGGGIAALIGITGLAGCQGNIFGGGDGGSGTKSVNKDWQYDPATETETKNRYYGSMDYGQMYDMRDQLPESYKENFEVNEDAPIDPSQVELITGVGGAKMDVQASSYTFFGSAGLLGSFEKSAIESEIESEGEAEQSGTYENFTLYTNVESTTNAVGSVPTSASATVGVGPGALLIGAGSSTGDSLPVSGEDSVKAMIDASNGNRALIEDNSSHVSQLKNNLGGKSMEIGGEIDPELVELFTSTPSGQQYSQFVTGIRAAGMGIDLGAETTTTTMIAVYKSASAAESSRLVELAKLAGDQASQDSGIKDLTAEYKGASAVITLKADTKTMLEQGSSVGGSNFNVAPTGLQ